MNEPVATLGQRLSAARERKGLSAQKAADLLRLDTWVVEALESGDYARVGPPVYVKGHLRRYAEHLGLKQAEVLDDYARESAEPPPLPPSTERPRDSAFGSGLPWAPIAGLTAAALLVAGLLWSKPWQAVPAAPAAPLASTVQGNAAAGAPDTAGPNPEPYEVAGAAPGGAAAGGTAPGGVALAPPVATVPPLAAAAVPALPASAAPSAPGAALERGVAVPASLGRARLRLSFSADSWVDVHDATGQRVFAGNGRANSVKSIAGAAPLRVYLKSASGVQLEINDHAAAIGPQFVAGDVARFEAGADGVLRRDTHAANGADPANARPRG